MNIIEGEDGRQYQELWADAYIGSDVVEGTLRVLLIPVGDWRVAIGRDHGARPDAPPKGWVLTTDASNGQPVEISPAPCGTGCRCAAAWRSVPLRGTGFTINR